MNDKDTFNELLLFRIQNISEKEKKFKLITIKKYYDVYQEIRAEYLKEKTKLKRIFFKNVLDYDKDLINYQEIPDFFVTALKNTKKFDINDNDCLVLSSIRKIYCDFFDKNPNSFVIFFELIPNDFISNNFIYKKYFFDEKDDFLLLSTESSNIKWKRMDRNSTIKILPVEDSVVSNMSGASVKFEKIKSFFNLFSNHSQEFFEQNDELRISEEEQGYFLKNTFLPNILNYYLNILPKY